VAVPFVVFVSFYMGRAAWNNRFVRSLVTLGIQSIYCWHALLFLLIAWWNSEWIWQLDPVISDRLKSYF